MSLLEKNKCISCEGGAALIEKEKLLELMKEIPRWNLSDDKTYISANFSFKNFYRVMAFLNAAAWICHQNNHHPDIHMGYNYVFLKYYTHALAGLSMNDFLCAKAINDLIDE